MRVRGVLPVLGKLVSDFYSIRLAHPLTCDGGEAHQEHDGEPSKKDDEAVAESQQQTTHQVALPTWCGGLCL